MSEIDFLGHENNSETDKPREDKEKQEIAWSEAERKKKSLKSSPFAFVPFLKKKQTTEATETSVQTGVDKNKLKKSRQEILKLIKDHEKSLPVKRAKGENFFHRLNDKLKGALEHKEVLVNLERAFNQEKEKKNQIGAVFNAKSFFEQPTPPKPDKKRGASWLDRLLSRDKNKIKPKDDAKVEVLKNDAAPAIRETKPEIKIQPPKPSRENKEETMSSPALSQDENRRFVPETNLIKGEIVTFFDWHSKAMVLIGAILAPLALIGLIYYGLIFYQKADNAKNLEQAKKFTELTQAIAQEETGLKEISAFNDRLKIVSQIFSQHLYWTNFFKFLEDNTIKDVYFTGFNGNTSGAYSLDALADNYSNIAEQVNVLKNNKKAIGAEAGGGEMTAGDGENNFKVKFNLNLSVLKNIFTE